MKFDLESWLGALELPEYLELFRSNKIDETVLPHLTSDDLKEMGITEVGNRRKLLSAARAVAPMGLGISERPSFTWQRRRVAIGFFDIVGFTRRTANMDPEDIQLLVDQFGDVVQLEVELVGGQIVKRLGDGLLAAFGWPVFHEDEERRAVIAAISAREALARQTDQKVQLKIGIAMGLVLVGGEVLDVTGSAVNLASRLQDLAEPDEILVTAEIANRVRDVADTKAMGPVPVKGLDEPIFVHRIGQRHLSAVAAESQEPALAGRTNETAQLNSAWQEVRAGASSVIFVEGPPGMGKTRLVQYLMSLARRDKASVDWIACNELLSNSPLRSVLFWLAQRVELGATTPPAVFVDKVAQALESHTNNALQAAKTLAAFYYPDQAFPEQSGKTSRQLRGDAFSALRNFLFDPGREQPSLLVIEDLHWADPSSIEFIAGCRLSAGSGNTMTIVTSRKPVAPVLEGCPPNIRMVLGELSAEEARQLISTMSSIPLNDAMLENLLSRGNGVPLFLTELCRTLKKATDATENATIPIRLSDLLTARIDRLLERRDLLLAASCLGRTIQVAQLAKVVGMSETDTRHDLGTVVGGGLIEADGDNFRFAHALVQDVAYAMLPRSTRKDLHGRVLAAANSLSAPPEVLARHAHLADLPEEAANWSTIAGRRALEAGSLQEAVAHFSWALDSLAKCSPSRAIQKESAGLHLRIAHAWNGLRGSGAHQTRESFAAAAKLAKTAGLRDVELPATYGHAVASFVSGRMRASESIARQMVASVTSLGEPENSDRSAEAMMAYNAHATALMFLGDFAASAMAYEKALAWEARVEAKDLIWQYGHDPRGVLRAHRALTLLGLGEVSGAMHTWREGLELVRQGTHIQSTVQPLIFGALLNLLQARKDEALPLLDEAGDISDKLELVMWRYFADALRGWALFLNGELHVAQGLLHTGLSRLECIGAVYMSPCLLAVEEALCTALGDPAGADDAKALRSQKEKTTRELWASSILQQFPTALRGHTLTSSP